MGDIIISLVVSLIVNIYIKPYLEIIVNGLTEKGAVVNYTIGYEIYYATSVLLVSFIVYLIINGIKKLINWKD